jgi:hypothetical protein
MLEWPFRLLIRFIGHISTQLLTTQITDTQWRCFTALPSNVFQRWMFVCSLAGWKPGHYSPCQLIAVGLGYTVPARTEEKHHLSIASIVAYVSVATITWLSSSYVLVWACLKSRFLAMALFLDFQQTFHNAYSHKDTRFPVYTTPVTIFIVFAC